MSDASLGEVSVLHVDDEAQFLTLAVELLEREEPRLSVTTATSAEEALSVICAESVDCVVSAFELRGRNGLELLELVRDEHPRLPFVLFTGKGSEEIASRAISAGVTDYLQKSGGPDRFAILANRILNAVRTHRAETAARRTDDRYHNLVDTAPIPILLFDRDGCAVYVNDDAVEFFGAEADVDLLGTPFTELLPPEEEQASKRRFDTLMREDTSVPEKRYRVRTLDDESRTATVATAPGYYRGERVAQAMVKRVEETADGE